MPVHSRWYLIGAPVVLLAALTVTVAAWPGTSGAAVVPQARAELANVDGDPLGTVTFLGRGGHATEVRVEFDLPTSAGADAFNAFHGLHVHANGVCDPVVVPVTNPSAFFNAGGHWDVGGHSHGAHLGDLPSILVGSDGTASLTADIHRFDVSQIAGRTVILHAGRDNFGNVPVGTNADQYQPNTAAATTLTNNTGNAGARYGCGVIEVAGNS